MRRDPSGPFMPLAAFPVAGLLLSVSMVLPAQAEETHYSVHMREDHPDVWSSIERIGPCAVAGEPTDDLVVPWEKYYPPESRRKNEMGAVVVLVIFDADSCPRSAMVIRSSGFPLLDAATLRSRCRQRRPSDQKRLMGNPA
jgi:hypothetical protein